MGNNHMSPSEHAKQLLVEVFKDIAAQSNAVLNETHIKKIEEAVDNIIIETSEVGS